MTERKTQAAELLALARSRRIQRALAHAYLHRHAPIPTLRQSIGFMTSTSRFAEPARFAEGTNPHAKMFDHDHQPDDAQSHRMSMLGVSPDNDIAYIVEELGNEDAPVVYRLFLSGAREGHLVPLHAWYECNDAASVIREKIAKLKKQLVAAPPCEHEAWMLSTRVIQRRALRNTNELEQTPIRKYALQLVVEPVGADGAIGRTTVTAFLRPEAEIVGAYALPDGRTIVRIAYTGIPTGMGASKETCVLLGPND